jgi:hypothetical protein
VVAEVGGRPLAVLGFTVRHDRIVEIDILLGPARLRRLDLATLDDWRSAPRPRRRRTP